MIFIYNHLKKYIQQPYLQKWNIAFYHAKFIKKNNIWNSIINLINGKPSDALHLSW